MDFELTRCENDEHLLPQLESIKNAKNIQALIPFAKAYLGMFYVIDSELQAEAKVRLLANNELATAIFDGFVSSLNRDDLPSIEKIGHAMAEKKEFSEGYVILAGLDLIARKSFTDINELDLGLIEKAVGFHFSNKSGYTNIWFDYLISEHKNKIIPSISRYWVSMLNNNATFLPGRNFVLGNQPDIEIVQYCILPLLKSWTGCKVKVLAQLLHLAFKYSDESEFLMVCEDVLENDASLNEKTRLYWIAAAYLISPDKYFARLSDYVGRVKLKVMPLLDFIILIMKDHKEINIEFDNKIVIQLLRMIAPIFPPQHHIYGALGELDINSKNVMLMFYFLVCSKSDNVTNEVKTLRKARVMKIYSAVIDNLLELRMRKNNEENFTFPEFDEYIETLVNNHCLEGRSNKFDLN
ncbi:MAG: hypothetical protein OEW99_03010 [Gammaproteobacteria bacterium]|nr:hypothetical protein [Gammaproteobacteria bacterium]